MANETGIADPSTGLQVSAQSRILSPYVFQWTKHSCRLIGKFDTYEDAVAWGKAHGEPLSDHYWHAVLLSETRVAVGPELYTKEFVSKDEFSRVFGEVLKTVSAPRDYIMLWDPYSIKFVGHFNSAEAAMRWGKQWQSDATDNPCWQYMHISLTDMMRTFKHPKPSHGESWLPMVKA